MHTLMWMNNALYKPADKSMSKALPPEHWLDKPT